MEINNKEYETKNIDGYGECYVPISTKITLGSIVAINIYEPVNLKEINLGSGCSLYQWVATGHGDRVLINMFGGTVYGSTLKCDRNPTIDEIKSNISVKNVVFVAKTTQELIQMIKNHEIIIKGVTE